MKDLPPKAFSVFYKSSRSGRSAVTGYHDPTLSGPAFMPAEVLEMGNGIVEERRTVIPSQGVIEHQLVVAGTVACVRPLPGSEIIQSCNPASGTSV